MNVIVRAESINRPHARILKARYYGELSYIDACLGDVVPPTRRQRALDTAVGPWCGE